MGVSGRLGVGAYYLSRVPAWVLGQYFFLSELGQGSHLSLLGNRTCHTHNSAPLQGNEVTLVPAAGGEALMLASPRLWHLPQTLCELGDGQDSLSIKTKRMSYQALARPGP